MQIILSEAPEKIFIADSRVYGAFQEAFGPEPGETVSAAVIFASESGVNLRLGNGSVINASFEGLATLAAGDSVKFLVSGNDGQRILLTPIEIARDGELLTVRSSSPSDAVIPSSGADKAVLNAIERGGYAASPELLSRAADILAKYPEAGLDTAVFIAANAIPVKAGNVSAADALFRSEVGAGSLVGEILDAVFAAVHASGAEKSSVPFGSGMGAPDGRNAMEAAPLPPGAGEPSGVQNGAFSTERSEYAASDGLQSGAQVPLRAESADGRAASAPRGEAQNAAGPDARSAALPSPSYADTASSSFRAFAESLARVFGGGTPPEEAGPGGRQSFDPSAPPSLEEAFFARAESGAALKAAAGALPAKLSMLGGCAANSSGTGAEAALAAIGRLTSFLELLNAVSSFACVQIPVRLGKNRATAELYVFRRKKRAGGEGRSELRAVLALDTAGMGRVEVLLRLRDRGISLKFSAAGEKAADYIRARSPELYGLLSEAGYRVSDIRVIVSEEKTTPINAMAVLQAEEPLENLRINMRV